MVEGTHLHVGLLKAWELWFQGKDIKGDGDVLWGLGLIWWGRFGVVAGFLGGLIIVLDIFGEERLNKYGLERWRSRGFGSWSKTMRILAPTVVVGVLFFLVQYFLVSDRFSADIALVGAVIVIGYGLLEVLVLLVYKVLGEGKAMQYARISALFMLVISMHFTLLTS